VIRNRTEELAERAAFLREIAIAHELGVVDARYARWIAEPPSEQDNIPEPLIGSYVDHLEVDEETETLPCAAHAAYHRARRYAKD
jgi:hypothetical protein